MNFIKKTRTKIKKQKVIFISLFRGHCVTHLSFNTNNMSVCEIQENVYVTSSIFPKINGCYEYNGHIDDPSWYNTAGSGFIDTRSGSEKIGGISVLLFEKLEKFSLLFSYDEYYVWCKSIEPYNSTIVHPSEITKISECSHESQENIDIGEIDLEQIDNIGEFGFICGCQSSTTSPIMSPTIEYTSSPAIEYTWSPTIVYTPSPTSMANSVYNIHNVTKVMIIIISCYFML